MWARGSYVFTCTLEDDEDFWTIENVATVPAIVVGDRRAE